MQAVRSGKVCAQAALHKVRFCSLPEWHHTDLWFCAVCTQSQHGALRISIASIPTSCSWQVSTCSCFCWRCQQSEGLELHVALAYMFGNHRQLLVPQVPELPTPQDRQCGAHFVHTAVRVPAGPAAGPQWQAAALPARNGQGSDACRDAVVVAHVRLPWRLQEYIHWHACAKRTWKTAARTPSCGVSCD